MSASVEPRVALVHDWLTGMRGGEKVLLELCRLFPSAKIYTLFWKQGSVVPEIERQVHRTSFLQNIPGVSSTYRNYLPLFPAAIRSIRLDDADLVISSSHAVAKGIRVPAGVPHVSYVHTPMRYIWGGAADYFEFGRGRWWKRPALQLVAPYLRRFDLRASRRVDHFIANSENVRQRIRRVYGTVSEVIPPPVDTDFFLPARQASAEEFHLVVSPLEPYKRIDLAIEAFRGLDRNLVIAGGGTQQRELQALAGPNVRVLGHVSDRELLRLYQQCRAVVVPAVEDFGMVPVEAQACGKPVICCGRGGATETVIDGETGIHFWPQQPHALRDAVLRAEQYQWQPQQLRANSLKYSRHRFRDRMKQFLQTHLGLLGDPSVQPHGTRRRDRCA